MPRAIWNGAVIAGSDKCEVVEGHRHFPAAAIRRGHLRPSRTQTHGAWKGTASCYNVVVGDAMNRDAGCYYPEPKPSAEAIRGGIAFRMGVRVEGG
jgi:uncharacterized protein (DUF427 family)